MIRLPSHERIHLSLGFAAIVGAMNSTSKLLHSLCGIAALGLALQAPLVHAEMLGPERAAEGAATADAAQDRAKLQQLLERSDVDKRLQALGVAPENAKERVNAMSDAEVHALAQRIDSMPAGGAFSQNDIILILLVAILIIVAL